MLNSSKSKKTPTIAHLAHSINSSGAGRAVSRIHQDMLRRGMQSILISGNSEGEHLLCNNVKEQSKTPFIRRLFEFIERKFGNFLVSTPQNFFSPSIIQFVSEKQLLQSLKDVDIVCIYWINGAFISPETIGKINKPIVWRLSDAWPFTGGCHYPGSCLGYEYSCESCPMLRRGPLNGYAARLLQRKIRAWRTKHFWIVAPSRWIEKKARDSKLFSESNVVNIYTGVNTNNFHPRSKTESRTRLSLPQDKFIVLFSSAGGLEDGRRGLVQFLNSASKCSHTKANSNILLASFGSHLESSLVDQLGLKEFGWVSSDDELSELYSAADVVALTSTEDNLPNVAIEALSCGAVLVGFNTGGMPELIEDDWNGFLAEPGNIGQFWEYITYLSKNSDKLKRMSSNSRALAVEKFDNDKQVRAFIDVCMKAWHRYPDET